MLRKIILSAAVIGALATPALAQSFSHDFGSGNLTARTHTSGVYAYAGPAHAWHHHYVYR